MSELQLDLVDGLPRNLREKDFWKRVLEPLRQHPGRWARVTKHDRKYTPSIAGAINRRALHLPRIWRAAIREGLLYVCYCGEASA